MFEESILEYLKNNLQVSSNLVSDMDMTWSLDQIVLTYSLKKKKNHPCLVRYFMQYAITSNVLENTYHNFLAEVDRKVIWPLNTSNSNAFYL